MTYKSIKKDLVESARILKIVLSEVEKNALPGITTRYLDILSTDIIVSNNAIPIFIGYNGYPFASCQSVNNEVVHTYPSDRELKDGDILSFDCGVSCNGYITDACRTFPIGVISRRKKNLIDITQLCLDNAIKVALVGNTIGDISYTIQKTAELSGYNVSREFTGHRIKRNKLHSPPWIYCFGKRGSGAKIVSNTVLAIEPVIFDGSWEVFQENEWSPVLSKSGCMSAHIEDTIITTNTGPLILTRL